MEYQNYTIRITRGRDGLVVEVPESLTGQGRSTPFVPPFSAEDLHDLGRRFETAARAHLSQERHLRPPTWPTRPIRPIPAPGDLPDASGPNATLPSPVLEAGRRLTRALLNGPVEHRLRESLAKIEQDVSVGLRIQIRIDPDLDEHDLLQAYPWELLLHPDQDTHFAFSRRTPIVRYLELPRTDRTPPLPDRLHILVAAPGPGGQPPLHLDLELGHLEDAWARAVPGSEPAGPGAIAPGARITHLEPPTLERLVEAVTESRVDVLHFMGHARHGGPDGEDAAGELLFEDARGDTDAVAAPHLARQLVDAAPRLRLVFLNACETARGTRSATGAETACGLAAALVQTGVPAVVAMQLPVSDGAARAFSRSLYRSLARGWPVDAAVAEGRRAIDRDLRDSPEWATPALFLRAPDGVLFETPELVEIPAETPVPEPSERWQDGAASGPVPAGRARRPRSLRRAWLGGALAVLVVLAAALAGGLLDRPFGWEPHREDSGATPPVEPAAMAAGAERPAAEPGSADVREGSGATGSPAEPAEEDRSSAPALRTVADGETVALTGLDLAVRVDFMALDGEGFARLTLIPGDGRLVRRGVVGPETIEETVGGRTVTFQVVGIDWDARTVDLRP